MKPGGQTCQVRGCRRVARSSVQSQKVVTVETPALNGSAPITGWRFHLCLEDERRVYEHLVDLIANGVRIG